MKPEDFEELPAFNNPGEPRKVFIINGGVGRVICSLPAFQKYCSVHGKSFYIISQSGMEFFLGTEFQDLVYDPSHKGLFKDIIKPNELVDLEPYHERGYYNQEKSLSESFDKLINGTDAHANLERPKIVLSKTEEINAVSIIRKAREEGKKNRTIVFQPFGRSAIQHETGHVIDQTSRSLSTNDYFYISQQLRRHYNVIGFTEIKFDNDENVKVEADLRHWAAIVEAADYFVGVDSCGQHMAYAFNKPGSVILGATFAENISYPKHFNIVEKAYNDVHKVYSPIRIDGRDTELADRKNDTCMDFTQSELDLIVQNILKHIKKTLGPDAGEKTEALPIVPSLNGVKKSKSKKTLDEIIDLNSKSTNTSTKKPIDKVLELNDVKS